MKTFSLILILLTLVGGCKKDVPQDSCGTQQPEKELAWLKAIIEVNTPDSNRMTANMVYPAAEITSYLYKGETVYSVDLCPGCPDYMTAVYNCRGEVICEFGGIAGVNTCPDFSKEAVKQAWSWKQ